MSVAIESSLKILILKVKKNLQVIWPGLFNFQRVQDRENTRSWFQRERSNFSTISSLHFTKWNTKYRERCTLPLLQSVPSILQNTKWNSKYMEEVHFVSITVTSFHFKKYTGHIISKAMRRAALLICPYTCSFCERNHPWTVQSTGLGKKTCNKYSWDSYSLWKSQ